MNLKNAKKAFGLTVRAFLLILLALTICTCSGPRLMLGSQTFEKRIDYSTFSGRLAKQIPDVMGCATLRTDVLGFHSWPQERLLIWQPYRVTLDLEYYPNLGLMLRRCSPTKWYQYRLITPSFSNRYRTVWTDPKPSLPIVYPHQNLQEEKLRVRMKGPRSSQVLIPPSIGRTQVTTPTMGRNSNSSSTMSRGSGNGRTTSSTTGGSRRQH